MTTNDLHGPGNQEDSFDRVGSEADFWCTLDLSPQIPWTADPRGEILEAGHGWTRITGIPLSATLGGGWLSALHPDDVEGTVATWSASLASGYPVDVRYRLRHADGTYRWFRARAGARRSGSGEILRWYGTLEDVDDQVRSEEILRETERRLHAVLNNASVAIFLMDDRQQCIYMNAAAEQLTGFTLAETAGRALHDVIHHMHEDGSPYPIEDCPIDRAFPENNNTRGEDVFVHKDGHFYAVSFTASPIRDDGSRTIGTIIEVQDITERRRASRELEKAHQHLLRTSRLSAVGAMASTLAHELNQPLTAVTNFLTALKMHLARLPEAESVGGLLDMAVEQTLRAGEIIRRIRSFTMTGELTMKPEDLGAILEVERQSLAHRIRDQNITVQREDAAERLLVNVDAVQVRQVIGNLLRNAADALSETKRPVIRLSLAQDGGFARLTIEDNGPGKAESDLEHLFAPFESGKAEGLGLGLAVCRTIVEAHGGRIWAQPSPLGGLSFTLTLPLLQA